MPALTSAWTSIGDRSRSAAGISLPSTRSDYIRMIQILYCIQKTKASYNAATGRILLSIASYRQEYGTLTSTLTLAQSPTFIDNKCQSPCSVGKFLVLPSYVDL